MRRLDFIDSPSPLSDRDIVSLESRFGFPIPSELKAFLSNHNGGRPQLCQCQVRAINQSIWVNQFFSIGGRYGIESIYDEIEDEVPHGYIPFANDTYGNLFVIDKDGSIYYCDYRYLYTPSSAIYFLNGSFLEFLESLAFVDGKEGESQQ